MAARRHRLEGVVKNVLAEHRDWGPDRVWDHLAEAARAAGEDPDKVLPHVATIGRIKARMPDEERSERARAHWPITYQAGLLPWEAAEAVFELARTTGRRPQVRLARWFWRVTLAAPNAPIETRARLAGQFATIEAQPELRDQPFPARKPAGRQIVEQLGGAATWAEVAEYCLAHGVPIPELRVDDIEFGIGAAPEWVAQAVRELLEEMER